jgi:hypothetical protein
MESAIADSSRDTVSISRGEGIMITRKVFLLLCAVLLVGIRPGYLPAQGIEVPFTCETPVAMTAPGLSAEMPLIELLMKGKPLEIYSDFFLEPEGLAGMKTLMVIIGYSGKGIGGYGLDFEGELERADRLLDACREQGIRVVGLHLGGEPRRGPGSDAMIKKIAPACDYVVVKKGGNEDGIFTGLCSKNNIPLTEIEKARQVVDVLEALFQR